MDYNFNYHMRGFDLFVTFKCLLLIYALMAACLVLIKDEGKILKLYVCSYTMGVRGRERE